MALFGKGKKKKKKEGEAEEETEEGASEEKSAEKEGEAKEGAEGAAEGAEGEGGAPKKSKKKIIILGVLALVILVGGAAGAYFAGLFGGGDQDGSAEGEQLPTKAVFYSMPEFLVNLNATGKSSSFLKTTIILELNSQTDVIIVEANLPRLMDAFNTYLRELRSSDLAGSAGIQRLREELLLRSNKALAPTKVNDILFKEIVVQ